MATKIKMMSTSLPLNYNVTLRKLFQINTLHAVVHDVAFTTGAVKTYVVPTSERKIKHKKKSNQNSKMMSNFCI